MSPIYLFDDYVFDSVARQASRSGENIHLTARLFDVLDLLLRKSGEVVSKDELINKIWHGQIVDENNLTVCIWELRKILSEEGVGRKYIETVPKRGYRFTRLVQLLDDVPDRYPTPSIKEYRWKGTSSAEALAVLPFINQTGDRKLEYLSDGLTETLINSLSHAVGLKVVAYHVIDRYRSSDRDVRDIAMELHADLVLAGRLTQRHRPYVSVELIDVRSGFQLAGKTLELDPADPLQAQKEIFAYTVDAIRPSKVRGHPDMTTRTASPDAYRSYLKGRYFFSNKSITATRKAIKYFERAVRHDERYPLAYVGLADCYSRLCTFGVYAPRKIFPKAKQLIQKALEIDDKLAEAHASLARIRVNYDWDWSGAESEFRRAIDLNPEYAPGYQLYAEHMARTGDFEEALEIVRSATPLDPLDRSLIRSMGMILYLARRYDKAAETCTELLEMDPSFLPAMALQGVIFAAQEKYDLAAPLLRKVVETASRKDNPAGDQDSTAKLSAPVRPPQAALEIVGALGYVYARNGNRRSAHNLLKELEGYSKEIYVEPHAIALIHIGLNNFDEAFRWLANSYADRSFILTFLKVWPFFDPIRTDRRFDELVEKVGFG